MNEYEKGAQEAFNAIGEEAMKLLALPDLPKDVRHKVESIVALARYQLDVRTTDERNSS